MSKSWMSNSWLVTLRQKWELRLMLGTVYTRQRRRVWLRHHRKLGTSLDEQLRQAEELVTGAFS